MPTVYLSSLNDDDNNINYKFKDSEVREEVTDLKSALATFTGNSVIPMVKNKYVELSGATVTMSDGYPVYSSSSTSYSCGIVSCASGDKFTINGTGGISTRLWGFIDASGNVLSVAGASKTENNLIITAPANSAFLITHDNSNSTSYIGELLVTSVNALGAKLTQDVNNILYGTDFSQLTWEKGGLNGTAPDSFRSACRCRMVSFATFNTDIVITPLVSKTGISGIYIEDGETKSWGSVQSAPKTVPKGTPFRLVVDGLLGQTASTMTIEEILATVAFKSVLLSIEEIQDALEQINDAAVPSYYFDNDYLQSKTLQVHKNAALNGIKFGFISDVHIGDSSSKSMPVAKYIKDNSISLPFMVYGGDSLTTQVVTEDGFYQQIADWHKQMSIFGNQFVYQCRGNHDYLGTASGTGMNASIGLCVSGIVGNAPYNIHPAYNNAMSYYYDVPEFATRIVVIDNYANQGENDFTGYVAMNQDTATWLLNDAFNVDNYNVIVVSHQPLNLYGDSEDYSTKSLKPIKDCLTAFKNHSSVNSSYGAVSFVKDFSTNTSKLLCVLSGHKHTDFIGGMAEFMTIGIASDCTKYDSPNYGKQADSITSGLFDCLAFDYTNAKVYATRIGAGYDRIFHYDAIVVSGTETLTSELTGMLTWASDDTSVATVSDGTVTSLATGSCIVSATDENGVKEAWLVSVA